MDLKAEAERKELEKRDEEYDKVSKKHKRKAKSLVEIHQEKVKKTTEVNSFNFLNTVLFLCKFLL